MLKVKPQVIIVYFKCSIIIGESGARCENKNKYSDSPDKKISIPGRYDEKRMNYMFTQYKGYP